MTLLSVSNLSVGFTHNEIIKYLLHDVSFQLDKEQTLAIIGQSGSGKTLTALALMQLLSKEHFVYGGQIQFEHQDLIHATEIELCALRGKQISMVFQDAAETLNPRHTIGKQLYEALNLHFPQSCHQATAAMVAALEQVGLTPATSHLRAYPHQLSRGEKQRAMIAMAVITKPKLLITDELTTALDDKTQKQIIDLLLSLKKEIKMSLIFITHNIRWVKKIADQVLVLKTGHTIEYNRRQRLFLKPLTDYARQFVQSEPAGNPVPMPADAAILLTVQDLSVLQKGPCLFSCISRKKRIADIHFSIYEGQTLGLVGLSGSGKTTTALAILKLIQSQGRIQYDGKQLNKLSLRRWRPYRQHIQIIFQDPYSSLNPRLSAATLISEGLIAHTSLSTAEKEETVSNILQEVGLDPERRHEFIHQFSGGERQRIAIARALILQPHLLILDEPTSALDAISQQEIIDLLKTLQFRYQIAYLFISHDLRLIYNISHRVLVMHEGKIIEQGSRETIFKNPEHPITAALVKDSFLTSAQSSRKTLATNTINWNDALLFGQPAQNR